MSGHGMFGRVGAQVQQAEAATAAPAFTISDLLDLPEAQLQVARAVLRAPELMSISSMAAALGLEEASVTDTVGALSMRGVVEVNNGLIKLCAAQRTSRVGPGGLFSLLGDL